MKIISIAATVCGLIVLPMTAVEAGPAHSQGLRAAEHMSQKGHAQARPWLVRTQKSASYKTNLTRQSHKQIFKAVAVYASPNDLAHAHIEGGRPVHLTVAFPYFSPPNKASPIL